MPITWIAHALKLRKASEHEQRLCPAPESTWNTMFNGDCSSGRPGTSNSAGSKGERFSQVRGRSRQLEAEAAEEDATAAVATKALTPF